MVERLKEITLSWFMESQENKNVSHTHTSVKRKQHCSYKVRMTEAHNAARRRQTVS